MCDGTADCADGTDEVGCEERAEDTTETEDVFGFEETTTEMAASTVTEEEVVITTVAPTQEELVQEEEEDIFGFDEASTPEYEVTTTAPAPRCNAACPRVNY